MGRIKNWGKVKRGLNKKFKEMRWDFEKFPQSVSVVFDGERWRVWLHSEIAGSSEELKAKGFKTMPRARAFAVKWMRRHPNG